VIKKIIHRIISSKASQASLLKYISFGQGKDYVIPKDPEPQELWEDGLPIPPVRMRLYGESSETHIEGGKSHWASMVGIMRSDAGIQFKDKRILEIGCANARILRHFKPFADECQIWGVDIDSRLIYWCREHMSPPFHFMTSTTIPHLPFEDRSFDIVYAGSVFTHIDELAEMWLLEVHRLLSDGGIFYFTIHDDNTITKARTTTLPDWKKASRILERNPFFCANKDKFGMMVIEWDKLPQVFYNVGYLKKYLDGIFEVISVNEEAFGLQTAFLVKKRNLKERRQYV
jgi:SAM-dependent methyltransferase